MPTLVALVESGPSCTTLVLFGSDSSHPVLILLHSANGSSAERTLSLQLSDNLSAVASWNSVTGTGIGHCCSPVVRRIAQQLSPCQACKAARAISPDTYLSPDSPAIHVNVALVSSISIDNLGASA